MRVMSFLLNKAMLYLRRLKRTNVRKVTATLLIISIAALVLPHFCCCIELSSPVKTAVKHSCCHSEVVSTTSKRTTNYGSHSIKNNCYCEHHSTTNLYVASNFEQSVAIKNQHITLYLTTSLGVIKDNYSWTVYNVKRGPPDHIGKWATKTYLRNQSFLL